MPRTQGPPLPRRASLAADGRGVSASTGLAITGMAGMLALILGLAMVSAPLGAEPLAADLPDPTRPPAAALQAPADNPRLGRLLADPRADSVAGDGLPVLQAVQMPSRGQPTAMIDGQVLRVGDRIDGMQLMGIDHMGITLRTPKGPRRIGLLLEDAKRPAGSIVINRRVGYAAEPTQIAADASHSPTANPTAGATTADVPAAMAFIQAPPRSAAKGPARAAQPPAPQFSTVTPGAANLPPPTPNAPTAVAARNRP